MVDMPAWPPTRSNSRSKPPWCAIPEMDLALDQRRESARLEPVATQRQKPPHGVDQRRRGLAAILAEREGLLSNLLWGSVAL